VGTAGSIMNSGHSYEILMLPSKFTAASSAENAIRKYYAMTLQLPTSVSPLSYIHP